MKPVLYTSPFVPAEWIAAHGFAPRRLLPEEAGLGPALGPREGLCPYARGFANAAAVEDEAAAVVVTTTCDQMRRASEQIRGPGAPPVFLLNVPATWQTVAAQQLYVEELRRLGRFLARLGGTAPAPERLAEVMREWDAQRQVARNARGRMSARAYADALAEFQRTGSFPAPAAEAAVRTHGVPVALAGGPLLHQDFWLYDLLEAEGGRVALDATETGERALPAPFDRRRLSEDPLLELAAAYFGHLPDAFRRPNSVLYSWLKRELTGRGVRGVLFVRCLWCDLWHAESARLKEWAGLPFADLDLDGEAASARRAETRVQALMGMLR